MCMSNVTAALPRTRRPTRKHTLCRNADVRGYTHHCSRLTWSEREHGATGPQCANPYAVGAKTATRVCGVE